MVDEHRLGGRGVGGRLGDNGFRQLLIAINWIGLKGATPVGLAVRGQVSARAHFGPGVTFLVAKEDTVRELSFFPF